MKKVLKSIWAYIKPLWEGKDGKPSIRAFIAIVITYDFIRNSHYAIKNCSDHLAEAVMLIGVHAALITALLGLRALENRWNNRDNGNSEEKH